MNDEPIWQVRLPNGAVWIPADAAPDDPRRSWIYSRSIAEMFARDVGGTVVEVTRRQKEAVLDKEIAFALNEPEPAAKPKATRTRARPFARSANRAIAAAVLENVGMNNRARGALDTARETADDTEHAAAVRTLKAGLPATLWIGYDPRRRRGMAQEAEPVWVIDDPQGEDPKQWRLIDRDEIARILVEGA